MPKCQQIPPPAIGTYTIRDFVIILHYVRNVYPVEKSETGYSYGFKLSDGFYETFSFPTKRKAIKSRGEFLDAIKRYWKTATESRDG